MNKSSKPHMIIISMMVDNLIKISGINKMIIDRQMFIKIAEDFSSKPLTSNKIGKMKDNQEAILKVEAHILNTLKLNRNLMSITMNALIGLHSTKERNPSRNLLKELLKRIIKENLSPVQLKGKTL